MWNELAFFCFPQHISGGAEYRHTCLPDIYMYVRAIQDIHCLCLYVSKIGFNHLFLLHGVTTQQAQYTFYWFHSSPPLTGTLIPVCINQGSYPVNCLKYEPAHEKGIVFRFVVLQMCMRNSLFGPQTWIFAWSFLKIPTTCLRTAKPLARLRLCTGSPEPLLVAHVISTFSQVLANIYLAYISCL